MKLSKYIHLFSKDNRFFLYAPLSNGFAELDSDTYSALLALRQNSKGNNELDTSTIDILRKLKVVDVDEEAEINRYKFNIYSRRFKATSLSLTINPTLSCNFACPYCFEKDHPNSYMSDDIEAKIIEYIRKHDSIKSLSILWFGGEPLLAFNRVESLTKKMMALGLNYSAAMISNGYLLTPEKTSKLESLKISSVQITINGNETTHDSRRFRKDGKPTYRTIITNIDEASRLAPTTRFLVRVNIDKTNTEEFFDVLKHFQSKNHNNVIVYPAFVNDLNNDTNPCICDNESKAAFLKMAYYKYGYYDRLFYPNAIPNVCGARCPNSVAIGPKGELYKCWNDVGNPNRSFGNIDGSITNEGLLLEYLVSADHLNDPTCNDCIFFTRCDGGCPYQRIQNEKKHKKESDCMLFKENIEDFLVIRNDYNSRTKDNPHQSN